MYFRAASPTGRPAKLPGIATAPHGDLRRRDLHPLVKQLASLRVGWSTGARTVGSGGSSTPFVVGLSPAPMVTSPAAPPKIPYGGFSPVRLQVPGTTQFSRESSGLGQWLKFDPSIRHRHKPLALAFGIASAEEVPASMCGAAASDNSTWTQRSSLRRACHGLTFIAY